jgi:hypothetical protein
MERNTGAMGGVRVRPSVPSDRTDLVSLGHPHDVARICAPSLMTRLAWLLTATWVQAFVAEEIATRAILASVQFILVAPRDGVWIFGYWRVAAGHRRRGLGSLVVREGARMLGEVRGLYSYVERGNDASIRAHERMGFEASPVLRGSALLGELSTIGPAAPTVRLRPVPAKGRPSLFPLYARAMGGIWMRLFPDIAPHNYLEREDKIGGGDFAHVRTPLWGSTRVWSVHPGDATVGLVCWRRSEIVVYVDPAACNTGILAQVAMQVMGLGAPRDHGLELRGLPANVASHAGPIAAQVLMGLPEAGALVATTPGGLPRLPSQPCGPR